MPDGDDKPKSRSFASAARLGAKVARLTARLKAEAAARSEAEKERDALKANPAPADVVKERDALKGQIRAGKHRAAFDAAAKAAKVKAEALDDLWELAKLDTAADEPDARAIAEAVAEKTKLRPYLLDPGQSDPSNPSKKAPLNPGPGSDRGGRVQSGGMTVKYSELADGQWMRQNQDRLREAQAQDLVTYVD